MLIMYVANNVNNWKRIVSITLIMKKCLTLMLNDAIMYCACL